MKSNHLDLSELCKCGHVRSLHAGAVFDCARLHCPCKRFLKASRRASNPEHKRDMSYQEIKAVMGK
jgi:hypothetical protein